MSSQKFIKAKAQAGIRMQTKVPYSIRNHQVTKTDEELLECPNQVDEPSISVTQSNHDQSFEDAKVGSAKVRF